MHPIIAVCLLYPDSSIERGDVCLLRYRTRLGGGLRGHALQQVAEQTAHRPGCICTELREGKMGADDDGQQNGEYERDHASIGDRLPGNLDSWLLVCWHEYPLEDRESPRIRNDYCRGD